MERRGMMVQLEWVCSQCSAPLMVQALSNQHTCAQCMATVELPTTQWRGWFSMEVIWGGLTHPNGEAVQLQRLFEKVTASCGRRDPRCQACETDLPLDQIEAFAAQGGYDCSCGARVRVREAGPIAQALVPFARWVVNEGAASGTEGIDPVSFQCSGCAAPLVVDGSKRTVECSYCSTSTFLPDGIWLRLHPKASKRLIFVVLEIDDAFARLIDESKDVKTLLAHRGVPLPVLERWTEDVDDGVASTLAANLSTPAAVLARMTNVGSSEMHKLLAAHPNCPSDALDVLAQEGWSNQQIAANPNARPGLLTQLATRRDSRIQTALAGNPATPDGVLVSLAEVAKQDHDVAARLARRSLPLELVLQLAEIEGVSEVVRMRPDYQEWEQQRTQKRRRKLLLVVVVVVVLGCVGLGLAAVGVGGAYVLEFILG